MTPLCLTQIVFADNLPLAAAEAPGTQTWLSDAKCQKSLPGLYLTFSQKTLDFGNVGHKGAIMQIAFSPRVET